MTKIYDCFSFFNELELLELRLLELYNYVDYFVLCEWNKTHSGKDKPYYYEDNKDKFKQFEDKIIHLKIDGMIKFKDRWTLENYQRNYLLNGLKECNNDDIIILSDLDEIPNPIWIEYYNNKNINECLSFQQKTYIYYINYFNHNYLWNGSQIFRYSLLKNTSLQQIRDKRWFLKCFPSGGWHFSYLGGIDKIKYKLESFAHSECDTEENKNDQKLLDDINNMKVYLDKYYDLTKVRIDDSFPKNINYIISKYNYLISV